MLRISQIRLVPGHSEQELEEKIRKCLRISPSESMEYEIFKRSIDARKKPEIYYQYTIDVQVKQEMALCRRLKQNVQKIEPVVWQAPVPGTEPLHHAPVIAGAGPAGLFCSWLLAREGYRPVLLERGAPVAERIRDVNRFWNTGILHPNSNVQFGEGGAGTFSDGKLNTGVKDPRGRNRFILETLVRLGAPKEILYEQKPHIGTDLLSEIVSRMREEICALGGQVRFHSCLTDVSCREEGKERCLQEITINQTVSMPAEILVAAIGHSARDTFQMFYDHEVPMEAKSFAVGVRIEHPQRMIQEMQYGSVWARKLPAASYKLAEKLENGRGVYTFCMCPGGYVVNASSEERRLAVNGMSYHDRAGKNANSAVIVTVSPRDFKEEHPLAGMEFQRRLESNAWREGQGAIPVQCFRDFCQGEKTLELGEIVPQGKGNYCLANVRAIFPEELSASLEEGIRAMDRKIPGFARGDALLSGVESRTSSPVRILRSESLESEVHGLYPCGEGAGYAGGITSAAIDGLKVAEMIIGRYAPMAERKQ